MERVTGIRWYAALRSCFPILSWLPRYNLTWLKMDLIAGLTVGLTAVPQALAYAEVAGLPVQYGLYSAFMGGFIYCVFGTSKDITLGPTAIMSLLCSAYIGGDPVFAVVLTLLCGVIQAGMALLRLGFLLDFISYPVIKGFTCAAAVTIGFGQVKNILGLTEIPQQFFLQVYYTFHKIPEARAGDVILGLCCLFFLLTLTLMKNSLGSCEDEAPLFIRSARWLVWSLATIRNALVVIAATAVAYSAEVNGHHFFSLTGKTAKGLPPFKAPPLSETVANGTVITFSDIAMDLGGGLAVIPLMGVLESIAIAKAFASKNNYRIDANQELFAIGLTNIMGSFVSAYPVTGSFGRTAVNSQTGVCSPAGGIVTGLDLLPFLVTFLVSFWEVQYGIVGGVLVSGFMLLYIVARPKVKVSDHGVLLLEPDSGLNFPVTEHLSRLVFRHALHVSPPRCLVLDCSHVSSVDFTVVHELTELLKQIELRRVSMIFAGLKPSVLKVLLMADLPGFRHTDRVDEALQLLTSIGHYQQQF
uniref:Sodium-independent sulfate anion transporter n=1 Tax=Cyprinus carpio carpio TaxID=630221 RepID=A0A9J7Z1C8_CYPCA